MIRTAAGTLVLTLALGLAPSPPAGAGDAEDQKEEKEHAEKVARKVQKALRKAQKAEQEPLEADRSALHEFEEEVAKYADLHAKLLARLGKPAVADAASALAEEKALAAAIRAKRATARQGDILAPAVGPLFRRLLAVELKGPDGLPARQAVAEGNPAEDEEEGAVPVVVRVNGPYAAGASRSTVPASVLLTLPHLPECLHYRFVGRDLILVDSVAQLIVDFLPTAAPAEGLK